MFQAGFPAPLFTLQRNDGKSSNSCGLPPQCFYSGLRDGGTPPNPLHPHFPPWQHGITAMGAEQSIQQMMQRKGWGGRSGFENNPCTESGSKEFLFILPAAKSWQISLGLLLEIANAVYGWALFVCFMGHTYFTGITFCLFPMPTASPGTELPPGHGSCLSCWPPAGLCSSIPACISPPVQFLTSGLHQEALRLFLC